MVRVEVAVYDLSRGLASSMSQQILGQRIDGIWHTGVVVYYSTGTLEYYFGGGIQCSAYGIFSANQGLYPVQLLTMGETQQSKESLEQYIASISHRFTAMTYDLLTNNCNNFSDTICRFLVGRGIPSYIVDLPNIVMSTPGGQAFRPMIEQMQQSVRMQHGSALPFGGYNSSNNSNTFSSSYSSSSSSSSSSSTTTTTTSNVLIKANIEESPLVSSDNSAATVKALSMKIIGLPGLEEDDKIAINNIVEAITSTPINYGKLTQIEFNTIHKIMTNYKQAEMASLFLFRLMVIPKETSSRSIACINDIVNRISNAEGGGGGGSFNSVSSLVMALCSLANFISHDSGIGYAYSTYSSSSSGNGNDNNNSSSSSTVFSNAVSSNGTVGSSGNGNGNGNGTVSVGHEEVLDVKVSSGNGEEGGRGGVPLMNKLLDAALKLSTHSRNEVRQMVSALLYNIMLIHTSNSNNDSNSNSNSNSNDRELPQEVVELLITCVQTSHGTETDKLVQKRKLSIVLRALRSYPGAAELLRDLEYDVSLGGVRSDINDDESKIVNEIFYHISNTNTNI